MIKNNKRWALFFSLVLALEQTQCGAPPPQKTERNMAIAGKVAFLSYIQRVVRFLMETGKVTTNGIVQLYNRERSNLFDALQEKNLTVSDVDGLGEMMDQANKSIRCVTSVDKVSRRVQRLAVSAVVQHTGETIVYIALMKLATHALKHAKRTLFANEVIYFNHGGRMNLTVNGVVTTLIDEETTDNAKQKRSVEDILGMIVGSIIARTTRAQCRRRYHGNPKRQETLNGKFHKFLNVYPFSNSRKRSRKSVKGCEKIRCCSCYRFCCWIRDKQVFYITDDNHVYAGTTITHRALHCIRRFTMKCNGKIQLSTNSDGTYKTDENGDYIVVSFTPHLTSTSDDLHEDNAQYVQQAIERFSPSNEKKNELSALIRSFDHEDPLFDALPSKFIDVDLSNPSSFQSLISSYTFVEPQNLYDFDGALVYIHRSSCDVEENFEEWMAGNRYYGTTVDLLARTYSHFSPSEFVRKMSKWTNNRMSKLGSAMHNWINNKPYYVYVAAGLTVSKDRQDAQDIKALIISGTNALYTATNRHVEPCRGICKNWTLEKKHMVARYLASQWDANYNNIAADRRCHEVKITQWFTDLENS